MSISPEVAQGSSTACGSVQLSMGRLSSVRLVMASKRDYVARQRDRIEKVEQLARRDKQNLYRIASFERLKDKGK